MCSKFDEPQRIRVVGICGSLRPGSYTRLALRRALCGAEREGAWTEFIDLREYLLPFQGESGEGQAHLQDLFRLREKVRQAHGIILGTPEYHGSFSGVLKNALDLMGIEEFEGKIVGLIGVSGGQMGGADALSALRMVCRHLHAWVAPQQCMVPQASVSFDLEGIPKDLPLSQRLMDVGSQVTRFAGAHNRATTTAFSGVD